MGLFLGPPGLYARIFRLLSSRHLPRDFFPPFHLNINQRFFPGTPKLQSHLYAKTSFRSRSTRYVPRDLFPPIFLDFKISFYSGTANSSVTPTPIPLSDSPPRFTYPTIFSRLSTYVLTKGFIQAFPTSNVTSTPTPSSDPPPSFTHHKIFPRHSTSIYDIFKTVLLRHSQPPKPPPRHPHIRILRLALPTLGFFPVSLHPF